MTFTKSFIRFAISAIRTIVESPSAQYFLLFLIVSSLKVGLERVIN